MRDYRITFQLTAEWSEQVFASNVEEAITLAKALAENVDLAVPHTIDFVKAEVI